MRMIKYFQGSQNSKFAMSLKYLKKEVGDGVHFLHLDKHQSFYKLALSFLIQVARHVQSTQNRKLVIFLQYLKKKNNDEVTFLHAGKHDSFLQVDANMCLAKQSFTHVIKSLAIVGMPNFPKNKHFLPLDMHMHVCVSGSKNCSFFGKFGMLCVLVTPVLKFALLPYYHRNILVSQRLLCSVVIQNIQIFYKGPVMCVVLFSQYHHIHCQLCSMR